MRNFRKHIILKNRLFTLLLRKLVSISIENPNDPTTEIETFFFIEPPRGFKYVNLSGKAVVTQIDRDHLKDMGIRTRMELVKVSGEDADTFEAADEHLRDMTFPAFLEFRKPTSGKEYLVSFEKSPIDIRITETKRTA